MEPRDIIRRVGLRTNASRLTDAAWRKKLADTMARDSAATWRATSGGMEWKDRATAPNVERAE